MVQSTPSSQRRRIVVAGLEKYLAGGGLSGLTLGDMKALL